MADAESRGLDRFEFKPVECGPAENFAHWRDAVGEIFDVRATPSEVAGFFGELSFAASRRFALCSTRHTPLSILRPAPGGVHDHFAIHLQLSGAAVGMVGDAAARIEPGDVLFIDLAQSLSLRLTAEEGLVAGVSIWAPRARVTAAVGHENALHGLALRGASASGATLGATMRALAERAPELAGGDFDALFDGFCAMALRVVAPILDSLGDPAASPPQASYVAVRRYIDRNLASPSLSPESIARAFMLSRASLYRLFEPAGGIATYIRKARLNRAFQEITSPTLANRRIGQIAFQLGFKNVSAFSRLFHEVYGVTPGEARERARRGVVDVAYSVPARGGESLTRSLEMLGG